MRKSTVWVATILAIHSVHLAIVGSWQSPMWDEIAHLPAGISHWEFLRFDLYRVNPPLPRMVAAAPIYWTAERDWKNYSTDESTRSDFTVGENFIRANKNRSIQLFVWARWACIPFSILGALVCFRWASDLYGMQSGFVALLLWCVSPNIIAWASTIMPDIPAASCGILAVYFFRHWLRNPNLGSSYLVGVALGIALLTKLTWIVLFGLLPLLWVVSLLVDRRRNSIVDTERITLSNRTAQLGFSLFVGLVVLNLGYGFEDVGRRFDSFEFRSRTLSGISMPDDLKIEKTGNRFRGSFIGKLPVPLPKNYVLGMDYIKWEYETGYKSYLRGEWKQGGWWYYYVYALLVKVPVATLVLFILAIGASVVFATKFNATFLDEVLLLVPAATILILVSAQTGFNHHLRYVVPALPFLVIWMSKLGCVFRGTSSRAGTSNRIGGDMVLSSFLSRAIVVLLLASTAVSSMSVHPWYISYFNEFVGSKNGRFHLLNSNVDFGQGLIALRCWQAQHPDAKPFFLATSLPLFDPQFAGIEYQEMPTVKSLQQFSEGTLSNGNPKRIQPGWYAISACALHSSTSRYGYLLDKQPVDCVANSIFIFQLSHREAEECHADIVASSTFKQLKRN